jgi:hypothetical protein
MSMNGTHYPARPPIVFWFRPVRTNDTAAGRSTKAMLSRDEPDAPGHRWHDQAALARVREVMLRKMADCCCWWSVQWRNIAPANAT